MILLYFLLIAFILIFSVSLLYFLSPKLSPVPFFPTQKKDIPLIVDEISAIVRKSNKSVVIDFGAGTGTVIFPLLKKINNPYTSYLAVEINPLLILIMHLKKLLLRENNRPLVILRTNMFLLTHNTFRKLFKTTEKAQIIIYLYVGKQYINTIKNTIKTYPEGTIIVSYMYDIPAWRKKLICRKEGKHFLYLYRL